MKIKLSLTLVILLFSFNIISCGKSMPPDCNDDLTKNTAIDLYLQNMVGKDNYTINNCSNGAGLCSSNIQIADDQFMDMKLIIKYVTIEKIDRELRKYECKGIIENNFSIYNSNGVIPDNTAEHEIIFVSEYADKDTPIVSIRLYDKNPKIIKTGNLLIPPKEYSKSTIPDDIKRAIDKQFSADEDGCYIPDEYVKIVFGDLDKDKNNDAIVCYTFEGCGGGNNSGRMCSIFINMKGKWEYSGNIIGDSVLSIESGKIVTLKNEYAEGDPTCCPSNKSHYKYIVKDKKPILIN